VIFQDGGRRHLEFSKIRNLNGRSDVGPICVIVPNFIKIDQTVAEIWRFNGFPKWRPSGVTFEFFNGLRG